MKIKGRLTLYVSLVLLFLLGSFYLIFREVMLLNIKYFEEKKALEEVASTLRHFDTELAPLVAFADDWGAWTDTYLFVQGKKPNYKKDNLPIESMAKQQFDFMTFTNKKRQLVYGTMIDHASVKKYHLTKEVNDFVISLGVDKKMSGIKVLDGKIYLVAVMPILMNMYKGPPQGVLTVGREMYASMMYLDDPDDKVAFSLVQSNYGDFEGPRRSFIESTKRKIINAVAIVKDLNHKPAVKVTVVSNRDMYGYARKSLLYLFAFLLVMSSLFGAGIVMLTRKVVYLQQTVFHTSRLASLGTLGAGIAHELNNPLAVVHGYAQHLEKLIEEKGIKDPECTDGVSKILTYTNRMRNIVEKIGTFSRSEESIATSREEDINSIINDSLFLIRKDLELKHITLNLNLAGILPKVVVNPIKMETILHNIIMNAKEELEDLPHQKEKLITINSNFEEGSLVVVKISDNGRGIPYEHLFRVFDPFFTTKPIGKGAGLGLSVVHGIIKELGGKIDIETHEGIGTTVILKIPAVSNEG